MFTNMPPGREQREDLGEQRALALGGQVVDRKPRDDRVVAPAGQRRASRVGQVAAHRRQRPAQAREALAGAREHRLGEVDEHPFGVRPAGEHQLGHRAVAAAEVEEARDRARVAVEQLPIELLLHVEQRHAASRAALEEARGQLGAAARRHRASGALTPSSRMSTKCPSIAAAAAICGETRCVRPPRPWRPSKLRLEVEAQRSPGCRMSGFMPRHIEQPATRQSKPASRNTSSRPSASACALTCWEPGTTIALTLGGDLAPGDDLGGGAQVADARVGARADEHAVERDLARSACRARAPCSAARVRSPRGRPGCRTPRARARAR